MKAEEINNYGKSMLDLMATAPQELMAQVFRANTDMIAVNLTRSELERFMKLKSAKVQTLQEKDLSALKSRGLESPNLVAQQIEWSASFAAFSEVKSETTSLTVFQRIVETTYPPMFSSMLPDPDVLASCDDPFDAFSNWFLAYMKANQLAGLFMFDLVEKNHEKFHFSCNWCAWREIHKCLNNPKACESICYADLVFFPGYCAKFGAAFDRPSVMGWGEDRCDFIFMRKLGIEVKNQ